MFVSTSYALHVECVSSDVLLLSFLLSDAVIRSEWVKNQRRPRARLKRRIWGMIPIVAGAGIFGFLIFGRTKTIEAEPKNKPTRVDHSKATPELSILGYEVILFKPHMNPFANVFFQNVGDKGQITVYSSSGWLSLC